MNLFVVLCNFFVRSFFFFSSFLRMELVFSLSLFESDAKVYYTVFLNKKGSYLVYRNLSAYVMPPGSGQLTFADVGTTNAFDFLSFSFFFSFFFFFETLKIHFCNSYFLLLRW
jgi:hypothetical protein